MSAVEYLDPDFWPNPSDMLKHQREEAGLAAEIEATLERPGADPDHNRVSRRVCAAHAAISLIPGEHAAARKCADIEGEEARRLTVLSQRLGHLARSVTYGDDLESPLLTIAACALAWLEQIAGENAR